MKRALFSIELSVLIFLPAIARAANVTSLPILMYHHVRPLTEAENAQGRALTVDPEKFASELDWLKSQGYETVTFADIQKKDLSSKPVILTFDDGYDNAFTTVYPMLRSRQMRGVFYIITGKIGSPSYMTADQIVEMQKAGMEMGAHTIHHPALSSLSLKQQKEEIAGSVKTLRDLIGSPVISFAYPSGKYTKETEKIAAREGIVYAVTTHHGVATFDGDALALKRLRMKQTTSIATLLASPKTVTKPAHPKQHSSSSHA